LSTTSDTSTASTVLMLIAVATSVVMATPIVLGW
jgi:hypothetical protein